VRGLGVVLALLGAGACRSHDPPTAQRDEVVPPPPRLAGGDRLTGVLRVGEHAVALTGCHAGKVEHVFVDVLTAEGTLRFQEEELYWNREADGTRGPRLDCSKLDRSWGGINRDDGTSVFRGALAFRCTLGATAVTGDLEVECGQLTADERARLDLDREDMRDERRDRRP
jgi:hypothetical protein